ncbi:hypothetical protein ACIA6E_17975 [Streptomyces sp. NPDC051815]|uniref:hypothetical protein n=1 Tax=Streptomyces sp. NPDC051815 TaxID=3365674 RepID=UPI0037B6BF77
MADGDPDRGHPVHDANAGADRDRLIADVLNPGPGTTKGQVEEMSSDLALQYSERATGIEPA